MSGNGNGRVGLVLISHSAEIVRGLADLVAQVAGPDVPIVTAGGGPDGSFGTDGAQVLEALRHATRDAESVVLMDLGSAILSVRAALEELTAEERDRLHVADAPLVEGAVAAGVAAASGASAGKVAEAAQEARLVPKL